MLELFSGNAALKTRLVEREIFKMLSDLQDRLEGFFATGRPPRRRDRRENVKSGRRPSSTLSKYKGRTWTECPSNVRS
jgi:hypothetical protein